MHPSKRGLVVVAAGLILALLPALASPRFFAPWAVYWGVLLLLFGADFVFAPRARDLRCSVDAPASIPIGARSEARLTIAPSAALVREILIKVDLSATLAPQPVIKQRLGAAGALVPIALEPSRRGPARILAAWIRAPGPLGLLVRTARFPLDRPVAAVPNLDAVRGAALRFFGARSQTSGLRVERFVGDGSEFDALEEFSPGLDHRTIDWKASARHGKLFSRRFRAERNHPIVFAIDTGRQMAEPLSGVPRLDHAIHTSLLLAFVSARFGDRVSLFAFDERPRLYTEPRSGPGAFRALKEVTGELAYTTAETNFTLGLTDLAARLSRRSLVIVLTDFVDTVTAELMVENLGRLSSRHLVVFVALRDPLLSSLAAAEPRAVVDLNRAVVADTLLREREIVIRRLLRKGIFCIDAPPESASADVLNRYLEIKRRELV
ncbi:DUF58 domain-containing protein [Sorangium sp. So ce1128]